MDQSKKQKSDVFKIKMVWIWKLYAKIEKTFTEKTANVVAKLKKILKQLFNLLQETKNKDICEMCNDVSLLYCQLVLVIFEGLK